MKKSALFLVLLSFVSFSALRCSSSDDVKPESALIICGTSDPINELGWMKKLIAQLTDRSGPGVPTLFKLVAYNYNKQTVIEDESSLHSSPYIHVFYCDGTRALKQGEYNDFINSRTKIRELYEFKP